MSGNWDDESFDVDKGFVGTGDRWEGEDEDDVKDNWEDSDEEETEETNKSPLRKTRKKLSDIIKEREEKRRQEAEALKKAEEEARQKMTPEEIRAEKARQEESDLTMALESMGFTNESLKGNTGIEAMNPKSPAEFTEYQKALVETITKHKSSPGYSQFFVAFVREIAVSITDPEDVRLASTALNVVANEKAKEKKGKAKKKKQKAVTSEEAFDDFVEGEYADFEDFM